MLHENIFYELFSGDVKSHSPVFLTAAVAMHVPQSRIVSTVMLSRPFIMTGMMKSHKCSTYEKQNVVHLCFCFLPG